MTKQEYKQVCEAIFNGANQAAGDVSQKVDLSPEDTMVVWTEILETAAKRAREAHDMLVPLVRLMERN